MWNFKGTLWNSTQNILPIHWKIWLLYNIEILRALRFKSSYAFLKRPPGLGLLKCRYARYATSYINSKDQPSMMASINTPSYALLTRNTFINENALFNLVIVDEVNCSKLINTLRPRQNGPHFADDIFMCTFRWKCLKSYSIFTEVCF